MFVNIRVIVVIEFFETDAIREASKINSCYTYSIKNKLLLYVKNISKLIISV